MEQNSRKQVGEQASPTPTRRSPDASNASRPAVAAGETIGGCKDPEARVAIAAQSPRPNFPSKDLSRLSESARRTSAQRLCTSGSSSEAPSM
jgi:hypothetical protein